MTTSLGDQRVLNDGRNDRLFRTGVTVAGIFVLSSLFLAAAMMFKGGWEAFHTF